ncbi:MAG TPA: alpha/beta fold hydrolase [Pyrinomonadaceae bacterium]|jgi:fermentation-respiration switch protein FrsA (DUF1100 family)|nr:alpha/beta fold hydrolase [Pyrinomonadaceae bacterium]
MAAAAASLLALAAVWLMGGALSGPSRAVVGPPPPELNARAVEFGGGLRGWLLRGREGGGAVVLMHGVRASRLQMLGRARFLQAAGYTVLLFDFQAHGESAGDNVTFGYLESRNARAAVEFVRASAPGERVGVIGVSLGGAAAVLAEPPLDAQALVLELVYPTIEQAVADRLAMRLGRRAAVFGPLLTAQLRPRLGFGPEALRPVARVGALAAPKLFVAGAEDRHTTIEESRQLFAAAAEPKEFWPVEGAGHEDLHALLGREYEQRILDFFGKHLRR